MIGFRRLFVYEPDAVMAGTGGLPVGGTNPAMAETILGWRIRKWMAGESSLETTAQWS